MTLRQKLALCLRILRAAPSSLVEHAISELPDPEGDEMQEDMNRGLVEILALFSTHGHSGFSASYASAALAKLLRFEPLGPLTGEADEWICHDHLGGETTYQNRRCTHVFHHGDIAEAYDAEGRVFEDPDGCRYTSSESRVPVTFPYVPHTEIVQRVEA